MITLDELKKLFDLATESMDFGSGFMDHEEVVLLRRVAVIIGVDVKEGTPDNFRASFAHDVVDPREKEHKVWVKDPTAGPRTYRGTWVPDGTITICDYCKRNITNPVHHGVSVEVPTDTYEQ
jgi:hypothetical protein